MDGFDAKIHGVQRSFLFYLVNGLRGFVQYLYVGGHEDINRRAFFLHLDNPLLNNDCTVTIREHSTFI